MEGMKHRPQMTNVVLKGAQYHDEVHKYAKVGQLSLTLRSFAACAVKSLKIIA